MGKNNSYQNPVLPGYHPDPSFCRVGEDFYMVTSTFEFFPGVPIYHSRNLVNWELIGHCLTSKEQLELDQCRPSGGIYAPTLRYHNGIFFMTTTNVTHKGNFIIHAEQIHGPWSEPHWMEQGGIDPSLYFEEDRCYFCSTLWHEGANGIFLCQIDPFTGKKLTESVLISRGCGGKSAEAPHIYRKDGYYYLLLAEGGTEYGHTVTISRSSSIYGPYEPCPHNPILSHVPHSTDPESSAIQATGHADILEDQNGNWWLCCLGIRPLTGRMLHNLGRESFLSPVVWKEDWPIVGNNGRISLNMEGPLPASPKPVSHDFSDDFSGKDLLPQWIYIRNPDASRFLLQPSGGLLLKGGCISLSDPLLSPCFVGIRQPQVNGEAETSLGFFPAEEKKAGLTVYYNNQYHYDLYLTQQQGVPYLCLRKQVHDIQQISCRTELEPGNCLYLKVVCDDQKYRFFYRVDDKPWNLLGSGSIAAMCTEGTQTMTFTGTLIGLFCEGMDAKFNGFAFHCK